MPQPARLIRMLLTAVLLAAVLPAPAQIVNRLGVSDSVFQRWAYCRMQPYDAGNLAFADTLQKVGAARENYRYEALGLALEFPVRFAQDDYARMAGSNGKMCPYFRRGNEYTIVRKQN